jgi:hypothetical protein
MGREENNETRGIVQLLRWLQTGRTQPLVHMRSGLALACTSQQRITRRAGLDGFCLVPKPDSFGSQPVFQRMRLLKKPSLFHSRRISGSHRMEVSGIRLSGLTIVNSVKIVQPEITKWFYRRFRNVHRGCRLAGFRTSCGGFRRTVGEGAFDFYSSGALTPISGQANSRQTRQA